MKNFSFHRFLSVARWDLTVSSKFYTRSALLMMTVICMVVVIPNLYSLLPDTNVYISETHDILDTYAVGITFVSSICITLAAGYMFHNLLTRQSRIAELTLPATNLERFLWHFVVTFVGVPLVIMCSIVLADALHALFRLAIPHAEISSLTKAVVVFPWEFRHEMDTDGYDVFVAYTFFLLANACYNATFALVNAWKYRHNIPLTLFIQFLITSILPLILIFIASQCFSTEQVHRFGDWFTDGNIGNFFAGVDVFLLLLLVGIWLLTYRLYCRAQLITKRNP